MKTIPRIAVFMAAILILSGGLFAAYFTDFALVVGSFKSDRNAEKFVSKLKQKGYETRVIRSRTSRGAMSRVIVGKFPTVREALTFKEQNLTDKAYKGIWVINMLDTSQLALVDPKSYVPGTPPSKQIKATETATSAIKDSPDKPTTSPAAKVDPKSITSAVPETKSVKSNPKSPGKTVKPAETDKTSKPAQTTSIKSKDTSKSITVVKPTKPEAPIKVRENAGVTSAKQVKEETIARAAVPQKGQEAMETKPANKKSDTVNTPVQKTAAMPQQKQAAPVKTAEAKTTEKPIAPVKKEDKKLDSTRSKAVAANQLKTESIPAPAQNAKQPAKTAKTAKNVTKSKDTPPTSQISALKKTDPKLFESFVTAYQKFIKAAAESDSREISQFIHLKNGVFVYINPGGGRVTLRTDTYQNVISIAGATISFGEKAAKTAFSGPYNKEMKNESFPVLDCSTLKYKRSGLFAYEVTGADCNLTQNYRASKETVNYKLPVNELEQIQDAERTIRYAVRSTESPTISTLYFSYIAGKWYLTIVDFTSPCLK